MKRMFLILIFLVTMVLKAENVTSVDIALGFGQESILYQIRETNDFFYNDNTSIRILFAGGQRDEFYLFDTEYLEPREKISFLSYLGWGNWFSNKKVLVSINAGVTWNISKRVYKDDYKEPVFYNNLYVDLIGEYKLYLGNYYFFSETGFSCLFYSNEPYEMKIDYSYEINERDLLTYKFTLGFGFSF